MLRDRDIGEGMNSVEDLDVFKLAHELALKIYSVTKRFSRELIHIGLHVIDTFFRRRYFFRKRLRMITFGTAQAMEPLELVLRLENDLNA